MAPSTDTSPGAGASRAGRLTAWLTALLLAVGVAPAEAADDPPGRVGRVTEAQGQSWFYDTEASEWVTLERNRPLTTGTRVAVDGAGRLELRIGSTAVRLAGGSELEIARLDDERIDLILHDGSVALRVRSPEVAREIEVAAPTGRFLPRGAGHFRVDRGDQSDVATAWAGELHFDAPDSAIDIPAGRSAEFWREGGGNATHYSWKQPVTDEFADWTARAAREDDRTAWSEHVSPEMTGAEDLNRYGSWDTHPEYGPIWAPTTVVAGWAPYRYGHWVVVRPWGWTWVDYAPWGFAPFHYGRWLYFGGRWCWAPGYRVARPVYSPALVAWVGGSPGYGQGPWPYVGWVPLAPREPYYPHYATGGSYWRAVNAAQLRMFPPGTPRRLPVSPTLYANQGVAGAISVVPGNTLTPRRPVAPVVAQVDPAVRGSLANQPTRTHVPPPGVARPIAVPGVAPGVAAPATPMPPRAPGQPQGPRQPAPGLAGDPPGSPPDGRRSGRWPPPSSTMQGGDPPRATISPPPGRQRPPADTTAPNPRVTVPTRPTGPAQPPAPSAQQAPTPAVRAPAPAAQTPPPAVQAPTPAAPQAPRRPDPGDVGNPRSPGRTSSWPGSPPQARAMPAPVPPSMRREEWVAPPRHSRPAEGHREAQRHPSAAPGAQARVRVPESRGHQNRARIQ